MAVLWFRPLANSVTIVFSTKHDQNHLYIISIFPFLNGNIIILLTPAVFCNAFLKYHGVPGVPIVHWPYQGKIEDPIDLRESSRIKALYDAI